jgi:hypothetical protein
MSLILKDEINQLRKELKTLGYKLKTEKFINPLKVLASIYLNETFIYGSGANVYNKETFINHKNAIDTFKKYELIY